MCTVSWSPLGSPAAGYQLFFNRDERRTRLPGLPPRVESEAGVRFLAPRDAEAGGTWVAVNQFGLTVGLLNLYQAQAALPPAVGKTSRGLLVRSLAPAADLAAAAALLARHQLADFQPFTLVVAAPGEGRGEAGRGPAVHRYDWDGREAGAWRLAAPPVVSSGHDVVGATTSRRRLFAALGEPGALGWEELHSFHRSHHPEKGAYSPCMHRSDAKTVSLTAIRVEPGRAALAYAPGSPCVTALAEPLELSRVHR